MQSPSDLHDITDTSTFRKRLKSVLFDRAYHWLLLALLNVSYSGALQIPIGWLIDWITMTWTWWLRLQLDLDFLSVWLSVAGWTHSPLPSARQHPSYGDCLEVKREYYQNSSVVDCMTQCSQSTAHLYEQFLQVRQIGFVTLGPLRCA